MITCCGFPTQKSKSSQKSRTENAEDGEEREENQESVRKSLTKADGRHSMAISDNARGIMEDDASDQQSLQNDDIDESKGTSSTSVISPPALECTSSLDDRLEFKRQIEEFMEATKVCLVQWFLAGSQRRRGADCPRTSMSKGPHNTHCSKV